MRLRFSRTRPPPAISMLFFSLSLSVSMVTYGGNLRALTCAVLCVVLCCVVCITFDAFGH